MNKSVSETSDGDFNVSDKYPTPEIEDDSDINSTNGDETDIRADDEDSVNFFIGAWVLVIYEGNCYRGKLNRCNLMNVKYRLCIHLESTENGLIRKIKFII